MPEIKWYFQPTRLGNEDGFSDNKSELSQAAKQAAQLVDQHQAQGLFHLTKQLQGRSFSVKPSVYGFAAENGISSCEVTRKRLKVGFIKKKVLDGVEDLDMLGAAGQG